MADELAGHLRIGDTVWLFDAARRPAQARRRVRAITVVDPGTRTGHSAMAVPWSVVRSGPDAVQVDLEAEPQAAPGSQVYPCDAGAAEATPDRSRSRAASVGLLFGAAVLVAGALAILVERGVFAFVLAQAVAAVVLALIATLRRSPP